MQTTTPRQPEAPTVLTSPAGTQHNLDALRAEFKCHAVQYNWHPHRHNTIPGVLHLTCMHPEDLRAAGCDSFIERGWASQPVAMPQRQAGRISLALALDFCALCLLFGLYLGICQLVGGPTDHEAALDVAAEAQASPISAAEQLRRDRVLERMALRAQYGGENAVPELRADGSIQWRTKRGHKTIVTAGVQQ